MGRSHSGENQTVVTEKESEAAGSDRICRPPNLWIALGVLVFIVNVVLVFVVIPEFSDRVGSIYSQNLYPDGYDYLAANLVEGNGYRFYPDTAKTLMREPGYPIFLAGIFLLFGKSLTAVKWINVFMALSVAWLITRIGSRVSSNRMLIAVAPVLFLLHPGTVIAESRGGVEILFVLMLTLFVLTVYRATKNKRPRDYMVSGGVLGLTVLVKSTPMLFPLFLFGYLVIVERRGNRTLAICWNMAVMIMAMLVVLSPWIVRNYLLTGQFVPTASVLGISAHTGQYMCEHLSDNRSWLELDRGASQERTQIARDIGYPFKEGYYQYFYSSSDELKFSSYLLKRVIDKYQKSPMLFLRCAGSNLFNLWFRGKTSMATSINLAVQLPYLILAMIGALLAVRNGQAKLIAPLVLFIVYYVAVYAPILAQARYSVTLVPFLAILACITVVAAQRKFAGAATRMLLHKNTTGEKE